MKIPNLLLRQLYTFGSLENEGDGFRFSLKNRLSDTAVQRFARFAVDGADIPLSQVMLELEGGVELRATELTPDHPMTFGLKQTARIRALSGRLKVGPHEIHCELEAEPFGRLAINARDAIAEGPRTHPGIPYDHDDVVNYSRPMVARRRQFVEEQTGASLQHVSAFSFDPAVLRGNIENATGVAQVPLGFAGPLRVNGEHAHGEFLIPLATTEGTLVASYSRGMKVLNLSGGVTCTVSADCM